MPPFILWHSATTFVSAMAVSLAKDYDKFVLRLPPGLRDRIKAEAERNNRSMNAEISHTLESTYPAPISLEEVVSDVKATIQLLKKFKGQTLLMSLADDLDHLMLDISRSAEMSPEDRAAAKDHVSDHGKFTRFVPPDS